MRKSTLLFFLTLQCILIFAQGRHEKFFMVLADPQLGMLAEDKNITADSILLEKAIQMANERKPAFLVVCGDLVNKKGDPYQINAYKYITAKLDPSIQLYNVAGNHDIGNIPGRKSLRAYRKDFGKDHYVFHNFGYTFLVINSGLFRVPPDSLKAARQQNKWLNKQLKKARKKGSEVIIFQHHPWFVKDINEPDSYDNLPQKMRDKYLPLFIKSGVSHIFCGHHHCTKILHDKNLEFVISGSSGKSLCKEPVGFRLVYIEPAGLRYEVVQLDSPLDE